MTSMAIPAPKKRSSREKKVKKSKSKLANSVKLAPLPAKVTREPVAVLIGQAGRRYVVMFNGKKAYLDPQLVPRKRKPTKKGGIRVFASEPKNFWGDQPPRYAPPEPEEEE